MTLSPFAAAAAIAIAFTWSLPFVVMLGPVGITRPSHSGPPADQAP